MDNHLFTLLHRANVFDKEITCSRNEYLVTQGKVATDIYFIEEGCFKLSVFEEPEQIIRFGYRSSFITCLDSFISNVPTVYAIQAIKKSKVKSISKPHFMQFIQADSLHLQLWNNLLQQLIVQQLEREIDVLMPCAKMRLQRVMSRSPKIFQEVPHKYIANYLRMSPETFSRMKKLDLYQ